MRYFLSLLGSISHSFYTDIISNTKFLVMLNINLSIILWKRREIATINLHGFLLLFKYVPSLVFRLAQERKVAGMVFWIISSYLICWLPVLVTRSLQVTPVRSSPLIDTISSLILHVSVVINPMLNLKFRKELRATIKRIFVGRNVVTPIRVISRSFLSAVDPSGSRHIGGNWTQSRS